MSRVFVSWSISEPLVSRGLTCTFYGVIGSRTKTWLEVD